ncbi:phosphatidylinositol transfer protein csr1 [Elasticomyces elasticus]|nr:phosphatidylinositol transfer protein csr1 [Elasticomyces elasticus]KAK3662686.1 phosphatidylinositol transfer protein csr1 [Elasticomyces elasticus]KAK4926531.1 phosphatidylinositol transfer protein csr1 [Elasticomyces elasticus]KAK5760623.1 phosphatidylinositol transfer protein csr1 [Elasticomyces elasticus]
MASKPLPGRPGNLTPEQEVKLKEMWAATLEVFGVVSHDERMSLEANTNGGTGTSTPDTTSTTEETKKKHKSRLSLGLGRKKDKTSSDSTESNGNDKHGQTADFKAALASQSPEELRQAFWSMAKHDHPDALLLRFLRARKWDTHAALVMLVATMHWRSQEMGVDSDIMPRGEAYALREISSGTPAEKKEGADFMAQLRMGKSYLHGTDKEGRPCCYVRVRLHKQGEQSEKSLERFTVYTIETARMMLRGDQGVDTATIVFDMTDFTMANMDYTPVKFMIKCFEANYPESLGSVLVYKSPWLFQGIWKIIKGWLDPVVASKVHFASNVDDLSEWIPKSQIARELGGAEDWTYTYVEPLPNENSAMDDALAREKVQAERVELVSSYEHETLSWISGEGSGEGRGRLAQRLRENYWRLDPYVRARSLYDRTGVIGVGGRLDFYPKVGGAAVGGGVGKGNEDEDGGVD